MKRLLVVQNRHEIIYSTCLTVLILALCFVLSCDAGLNFDLDNDCDIDSSILNGSYETTDNCSMPWGTSNYTISIEGSCKTYTISNLFSQDNPAEVRLDYDPEGIPRLRVPEQQYQGWTLYGTGGITLTHSTITLNLTLKSSGTTITCTMTGIKNI